MITEPKTTWRTVKLGDIADINAHSINSNFSHKKIEYIDISAVGNGVLSGTVDYELSEAPGRARRLVMEGDTIISTVRPNRRSFLYMKNPRENTIASTGFAVLSPKKETDARFLYYLVTCQQFTDYLSANVKGSAYPAVSFETIEEAEVSAPTLPEQKSIAGILSAFDEKIENNNRIIRALEEMAQAIFKERFVLPVEALEKKSSLPKGWENKKIYDIAKLNRGVSYRSAEIMETGEGVPLINLANFLRGGGFNAAGTKNFIGKFKKSNTVKPGQILIAMTDITSNREIVGHPARVPESLAGAIISLDVCSLDTQDEYVEFLYFLMLRKSFAQIMASSATGTNVSHLSKTNIEEFEFILPGVEAIEKFNDLVRPMVTQQDILNSENKKLAVMRDLLLPQLMNGEIRV